MKDTCFYIVIPVYRAEKFLEVCVSSVQAQTWQNFRIVLIDDGSPDGSGALCDALAAADSRIHVIHQANAGPYCARRAGIRWCREQAGEEDWAMFLDADDGFRPNALERVRETFLAEDCDMVFLGEDKVWDGRVLTPFPRDMAFIGTVTDKRELYRIVFRDGWYNPLWKKAVKASLLPEPEHPEYYPVRFGEDLLQSMEMYRDCRKAVFLPDSLYCYAVNPDSATNTVRYENYKVDSTVLREVWAFLKAQDVWSEADFREYLAWARRLTRFAVWTVAKFRTATANRCRLLEQLRTDSYYDMVISGTPAKDITLLLMKHRLYLPLCLAGTAIKTMGNLRRSVRRLAGR